MRKTERKPPGSSIFDNPGGRSRRFVASTRCEPHWNVPNLVVPAASAARFGCSVATLPAAQREGAESEEDSPARLFGEEVVEAPIHQAFRDGPEHQVHQGADHPAEGVLGERTPAHLLRDRDHIATEVAEAVPDAVEEVREADQDVPDDSQVSAVEVDGVRGVVEVRAADHCHDDERREHFVVPGEADEEEREADDPPDDAEGEREEPEQGREHEKLREREEMEG